eukprot:gene2781-12657_t
MFEIHALRLKIVKTPAQVLLRWGLQQGAAVLPKSITPNRIKEFSYAALGLGLEGSDSFWELSPAQMGSLNALEDGHKPPEVFSQPSLGSDANMVRFNLGKPAHFNQIKIRTKKKNAGNKEMIEHKAQLGRTAGVRTAKNMKKNNKEAHKVKMLERAAKRGQTHKLDKAVKQAGEAEDAEETIEDEMMEDARKLEKKAKRVKKTKAVAMQE